MWREGDPEMQGRRTPPLHAQVAAPGEPLVVLGLVLVRRGRHLLPLHLVPVLLDGLLVGQAGLATDLGLLLAAPVRAAVTETCLTGTAPDVMKDAAQIRAVRALIDAACPCSRLHELDAFIPPNGACGSTPAVSPFTRIIPACARSAKTIAASRLFVNTEADSP